MKCVQSYPATLLCSCGKLGIRSWTRGEAPRNGHASLASNKAGLLEQSILSGAQNT